MLSAYTWIGGSVSSLARRKGTPPSDWTKDRLGSCGVVSASGINAPMDGVLANVSEKANPESSRSPLSRNSNRRLERSWPELPAQLTKVQVLERFAGLHNPAGQAGAGGLKERQVAQPPDRNRLSTAVLYHLDRLVHVAGQVQRAGEVVERAQREDAQGMAAANQPTGDEAGRAIAAGHHHRGPRLQVCQEILVGIEFVHLMQRKGIDQPMPHVRAHGTGRPADQQ